MQMQFGVLFVDQRVRWLPEGSLDSVRSYSRHVVVWFLLTLILSYDQWYANCTEVASVSTFVPPRVLSLCVTE